MREWIIGDNAAGKTVILEKKLESYLSKGLVVVTNLRKISYEGFNSKRLAIMCSDETAENILDYTFVSPSGNRLLFDGDVSYSDEFINTLTLLCRKGDILILDEPEYGLRSHEILIFCQLLPQLLETFISFSIVTHCELFMSMYRDCWKWCQDYSLTAVAEENLNGYISKF